MLLHPWLQVRNVEIGDPKSRLPADTVGNEGILGILGERPRRTVRNGFEEGAVAVEPNPPDVARREIRGIAFCCATACMIGAAAMMPTNTPPASNFSLPVNNGIVAFPLQFCSVRPQRRHRAQSL